MFSLLKEYQTENGHTNRHKPNINIDQMKIDILRVPDFVRGRMARWPSVVPPGARTATAPPAL